MGLGRAVSSALGVASLRVDLSSNPSSRSYGSRHASAPVSLSPVSGRLGPALAPTGLQLGNLSLPGTCDVTPMPQAEDGLPPFQTSVAGLCLLLSFHSHPLHSVAGATTFSHTSHRLVSPLHLLSFLA